MSLKKSKLDLLVRVRYANPLPPPPCPPKLLNIPTDPMRYANPEFVNSIASETPLPMIVDAELGMPLDLSLFESFWEEGVDDRDINPDPHELPTLDPEDAYLAADHVASTSSAFIAPNTHGFSNSQTPAPSAPLSATWLRRTEYITGSREGSSKSIGAESKHVRQAPIDVSRPAQIAAIEASFATANDDFNLSALKHPNKPDVKAVESFEFLPDEEIWANSYDLYRFSERPGPKATDTQAEVDDACLECAVLRPISVDGEHFLAYYLVEDEATALEFQARRQALPSFTADDHETLFQYVRDYETTVIEQSVSNEFVLVLDDGSDSSSNRPPGAYYKNIERKMTLRKRRANAGDDSQDKWDRLRLTYAGLTEEEQAEMNEFLAEVSDPGWIWRMKAAQEEEFGADAEGEPVSIDAET